MKPVNLNGIQNGSNATEIANAHKADAGQVRPAEGTSGVSGVSDHVTVSSRAEDFARLVAKAGSVDDIRHEKVADLRHRVQSGQYMVSSETIAAAILRDEDYAK